jgi:hypothetical protein
MRIEEESRQIKSFYTYSVQLSRGHKIMKLSQAAFDVSAISQSPKP